MGGHPGLRLTLGLWLALAVADVAEPPGLGAVLGFLPGMSRVAFYRYGFPQVELAVVVLAALGLDRLAAGRLSRRNLACTSGLALALVALAVVEALTYARRLGHGSGQIRYLEASAAWGIAVVVAGAAAMLLRGARARVGVASAIVIIEALVLFLVPEGSAPRSVTIARRPLPTFSATWAAPAFSRSARCNRTTAPTSGSRP